MRTRLFRSFLLIILIALFSSIVFQRLMVKDFDLYVESVKEDQLRWVLASVESSYGNGRWDIESLTESLHWAMMLGLDASVLDNAGQEIYTSRKAIDSLPAHMADHMEHLFHLGVQGGPFQKAPLILEKRKIGTLLFRPFPKKEIKEKETAFKEKTAYFLYISLGIAGGGALFAAILLIRFLSRPLLRVKEAANRIARGDFDVRIDLPDGKREKGDEIVSVARTFNFMAESLQKEESLRRRLLSNISHELRTPLTIMKAHIEALEDGILEEPEAALQTIKAESEKLIELIRGIEDLTLAESEFMKPGQFTSVDLKEFFERLMREMLPLVREKGLRMEMGDNTDLTIDTDVNKLEKIVRNLLSNAVKFSGEGSVILISYRIEKEVLLIEIKDDGPGIPESDLPHVFDRFYRVERPGPAGLGLGLAIVKEGVSALGGRIDVESKPGEGTLFRVHLPQRPSSRKSS
ncbi:MAG: sensor histidine kinase [Desulfobacteraceae bacterium]|nr:MAG: sensor histidine kinase [Desulfobacteraceae bacterium]